MISKAVKRRYRALRQNDHISSRKAANLCGIARSTGDKYWKEYQELQQRLAEATDPAESRAISRKIKSAPAYDSSSRKKRVYTPEVEAMVTRLLTDEEYRTEIVGDSSAKAITAVKIHEIVTAAGYHLSLSTITKRVKEIKNHWGLNCE